MKTCLVAGGAGFIGSWLCKDLIEKGYRVVCLDNMITGHRENINIDNNNFVFVNHNVINPINLEEKIDFIFHLASPASPVHYQKHPVETLLANSVGTMNLLTLAEKNNARFLFASSSEVYGDPKEHPQKETYFGNVNPNGPRSCYDEGKRFGEALVSSFSGVDWRIVRLFNTYGPCMNKNDGRVVPNFITQALSNKPITIYGDGKQTRSFCYISDMIKGLERTMVSDKARGQVINLGNPSEITMLELADIIIELTGSKSEIIFKDMPVDDPTRRRPDITKAKNLLGWEPNVDIRHGLKSTIDYFKSK
ncbi:MAG: UDP-glucuronic acid decarboxylase family protein [Candidatus Aenigmatarchaeota archaeon]